MILTTILFLVIPWIIALLHLNPKDKKLIPLMGPIASTFTFFINDLWFYFDFGEVYPFSEQKTVPALPFNLGLYPVLGCYLIFFIRKSQRPYFTIFLISLCVTMAEYMFLSNGGVTYRNGWNILWTWIAYFASFFFGYCFYLYLKKVKAME